MVTKVKSSVRSYTAQHKAALKPTIVVEDVTPIVKPTLSESIHDDVRQMYAKYKVAVPSTTRFVVSCVATLAISFGIGYIGSVIVETLVIASLMLTGSLFLGVAMYVLGVIASLYASFVVAGFVNNFIMSGDIDRSYQKYSDLVLNKCSSVRGFFAFKNKEVTA